MATEKRMTRSGYVQVLASFGLDPDAARRAADLAETAGIKWEPEEPTVAAGARALADHLFPSKVDADHFAPIIAEAVSPLIGALSEAGIALSLFDCTRGRARRLVRDTIRIWQEG